MSCNNEDRARLSAPQWDYAELAAHYELRAPYHPRAAAVAMAAAGLRHGCRMADIGAGTGRVARAFAQLGCNVDAVEPCLQMEQVGRSLDIDLPVQWHRGTGEHTGLASGRYHAVCFGSSLNVVDSRLALAEARRLLRPAGVLLVLYNHRNLADPLQAQIEACVRSFVPDYDPGARRSDPQPVIEADGVFRLQSEHRLALAHRSSRQSFVDGFRAHATLVRQAGAAFPALLQALDDLVRVNVDADDCVSIPFDTRLWVAGLVA